MGKRSRGTNTLLGLAVASLVAAGACDGRSESVEPDPTTTSATDAGSAPPSSTAPSPASPGEAPAAPPEPTEPADQDRARTTRGPVATDETDIDETVDETDRHADVADEGHGDHVRHADGEWILAADDRSSYADDRTPTKYSFFDWRNETRPGWGPSRIGFLVECQSVGLAQIDPIVAPGSARSDHLHEFFGNPDVTPDTSTLSLTRTDRGDIACSDVNDKSAYWSPVVYQDGEVIRATTFRAYYKSPTPDVTPMPLGLRVVAGDAAATSNQPSQVGFWEVNGRKEVTTADSDNMIERPPGANNVQLRVNFPQCWDGMHLDSPDHQSHMTYAVSGTCPASHPVRIPQLVTFTQYDAVGGAGFELSSGPWFTFHQDFWNAWAPDQMSELTSRCIAAELMCRIRTTQRLIDLGQFTAYVPRQ